MKLIPSIEMRRSYRTFEDRSIEQEKINILKESLLRAPTSKNKQAWEFVMISDRVLNEKLSIAKPQGGTFLAQCPLSFVVCANVDETDCWVEDASIASAFMQLQAEELGLGSCWVQIRARQHDDKLSAEKFIQDLLSIPSNYKVLAIIGVGYCEQRKNPRSYDSLRWDKIHENKFNG
ncbi:MAG: nitroreductase family protein [Bacteroidales bacterium]